MRNVYTYNSVKKVVISIVQCFCCWLGLSIDAAFFSLPDKPFRVGWFTHSPMDYRRAGVGDPGDVPTGGMVRATTRGRPYATMNGLFLPRCMAGMMGENWRLR
ncbi:MAG TPA: hypothetical protein PLD47_14415 [Aggregatilineales bacterium]|nr:hypothetical protein [Anaerolineales bacterium]HRE48917.1 hypothetical protein [Aggregatilineales bacterium]